MDPSAILARAAAQAASGPAGGGAAAGGGGGDPTYGETLDALKGWVQGADAQQYTQLADGMVQVTITHSNLRQRMPELRLSLHSTVAELKAKLHSHTGTMADKMTLELRSGGETIARLVEDHRPFGYYSPQNGMVLHVIDNDPFSLSRNGGLENTALVEKYRMSEEEYDKRPGTLRAYKKEQLAKDPTFRFLPENREKAKRKLATAEPFMDEACVAGIEVGMRCEVSPGARRGEVAFVGQVEKQYGYFVGVRFDEPVGKGDGTSAGRRYFEAERRYGGFHRPSSLKVGDYPERDDFLDSDEEDEDDAAAGAAAAPPAAGEAEAKAEEEDDEDEL